MCGGDALTKQKIPVCSLYVHYLYRCRLLWFNLPCAVRKEELTYCGPSNFEKYETTMMYEECGGIVGTYSSGTKMTWKAWRQPLETTQSFPLADLFWSESFTRLKVNNSKMAQLAERRLHNSAIPGSNPAVSGSYEIDLKIQSIFPNNEAVAQMFVWLTFS